MSEPSRDTSLIFGKYLVIRRLMVGGMGEIFLARQVGVAGFDRLVILKTLLPELAEQPTFVEQFLDEARVAATLNHPNIVNIYEVGEWGGMYVIAMEYIRGDNLARLVSALVRAKARIPARVAARIVLDAASALEHAHSAHDNDGRALGIVHRDIGLQNIMVRIDGVTKVVDFGIARAANRSSRTRTGVIKGKLQYMSPEQVSGDDLDGRSDEFSLGVVLWELLTRERLFKGDNEFQTLQLLLSQPIPRPSTVDPVVDTDLEAITMRMLERERDKRYPRCGDVAEALRGFLTSTGGDVAEREVATIIEKYVGQELSDATRDLTPSQESFAALHSPLRQIRVGGPDAETRVVGGARKWRRLVALGFAVLMVAAVAGMVAVRQFRGAAPKIAPAPAAPPSASAGMTLDIRKPVGATVLIDGTPWPEKTPTQVRGLAVGAHEVQLMLPGKKTLVKRLMVEIGKPRVVDEPPPASGSVLDIRDPPGAQVVVDGKPWPELVPTVVTGLTAGSHRLEIVQKGQRPVVRQLELLANTPILVQPAATTDQATLMLETIPEGATVQVDGRSVGFTPLKLDSLEPSVIHDLDVSRTGYESLAQTLTLSARETKALRLVLTKLKLKPAKSPEPAPTPPAPAPAKANGYLTLNTEPWVKVSIDDKPYGSTPLYKVELAPGPHSLHLANEGAGISVVRKVTISSGETTKLNLGLLR